MATWLIVDDEPSICWALGRLGQRLGHQVRTASSAEQALALAEEPGFRPDTVVLDVRLPGISGLEAIERMRQLWGSVPIIVITAYGDLPTAVQAVRRGAFEYVVKPFDLDQMQRTLERALRPPEAARPAERPEPGDVELVGTSNQMQTVFHRIALAAESEACVLVGGESGTGKELAARAIHRYGPRSAAPFVAVNIASLSPTLVESELFGHVRGSFTGAASDHQGLLVRANGGTLFLDEVADIPKAAQIKLLRVLEERMVEPVGASRGVPVDFRLIAATHQDLAQLVREARFRHDLYFRLGAFRIDMPALRDRPDDIPVLVEHLLRRLAPSGSTSQPVVSVAAMSELQRREWHGNVRELRHALEHAAMLARGRMIEPEHLPPPAERAIISGGAAGELGNGAAGDGGEMRSAEPLDEAVGRRVAEWVGARLQSGVDAGQLDSGSLYEELLQLIEPPLLSAVLDHYGGQCATAARQLGLHRTTVRKKLDQYGLTPDL